MRARELRLRRALRAIVAAVAAAPAGVAACGNTRGGGAVDASLASPDASAPAEGDGAAPGTPDGEGLDATGAHEEACAPYAVDASNLDPDGCSTFHVLPCGVPPDAAFEGCFIDLNSCVGMCGSDFFLYCKLASTTCSEAGVLPDATTLVECEFCATAGGRRPRGLEVGRAASRAGAGEYFAALAHLESASVRAFADLERWLTSLGAPPRLAQGAREAAADERRHARATSRLARRFGGAPRRPRVRRTPTPSVVELLEDDAVEGCVGETFGALVATWLGEHAGDARIRRTMSRIARDETRHAALSWEILRWGAAGLSARERLRLERATDGALAALEARVCAGASQRGLDDAARRTLGHPAPRDEQRLVCALATLVRAEMANHRVMRGRPRAQRAFK